jgi:hypothetical protein
MSNIEKPELLYDERNPKHKEPWQRGRRGSLCPRDLKLKDALKLLREESILHDESRYAVFNGRAFKAAVNHEGVWHGWPVGWMEVPASLRNQWRSEKKVSNRELNRFWNADSLP